MPPSDEIIQGRIAVLETLLTKHEALPIHPLAAQMLQELQTQVSIIREHEARREERDMFIKTELLFLHGGQDEVRKILTNGLNMKVANLIEDVQTIKNSMSNTTKDFKSILFPIVTHVIELAGALLIVLGAARMTGIIK